MSQTPNRAHPWTRESAPGAELKPEIVEFTRDETEAKIELLTSVEPFGRFDKRWLRLIAGLMVEEVYEKHQVIYRAGDPSDATYLISEGEVAIYTDIIGQPVQLKARLEAGAIFGDVGVLEACSRTTSAQTSSRVRLQRLEAIDVQRLARANPAFGMKLVHSALLRCMREPADALERGQHHDLRIRVGRPVFLSAGDRDPLPVELENLSIGGCCVRGVPHTWHLFESTPISIRHEDGSELFETCGRIAWRRAESVGIAFMAVSQGHGQRVQRALELLLEPGKNILTDQNSAIEWLAM